ncbi:MAG TPA: hypothetical protein VFF87_04395 [Hyphomicrobium sp.]|nr:hypothetical protein [Hyphomicrobium sp.]
MTWKCILASAALAVLLTPAVSFADSIGDVEGARAKERQGRWLNRQDREQLRRWGGSDDYGYRGYRYYRPHGYYDDYRYGYGPGIGIYVGP